MNIDVIVDNVMKTVRTDTSGKWVPTEIVRQKIKEIMEPDHDFMELYYKDLSETSANIEKST